VPDSELTPESIAEAATKPAEASGDQGSAKAVPISDQIEADKYQKAAQATSGRKSGWRGVVTARVLPPGSV
jgi:hypothetical protein